MTDEDLLSEIRIRLLEPLRCELWELEKDPSRNTLSNTDQIYWSKLAARDAVIELIRRYKELKETNDEHRTT